MGSSPLMALGLRAMAASYAALQTTGHNIANANVAGYSRQQTELATAKGLQRAGYATDPAYADKLTKVINTTLRLQRLVA